VRHGEDYEVEKYGLTKILSFHGTVKEGARFAEALARAGIGAVAVHGNMEHSHQAARGNLRGPTGHRRFGDDLFVLCNARLFGEGIEHPALDAVSFWSLKSRVVDITQQVGHGVRKVRGKTIGHVITRPAGGADVRGDGADVFPPGLVDPLGPLRHPAAGAQAAGHE
jgi:superfamily II DNA or RNA helicase